MKQAWSYSHCSLLIANYSLLGGLYLLASETFFILGSPKPFLSADGGARSLVNTGRFRGDNQGCRTCSPGDGLYLLASEARTAESFSFSPSSAKAGSLTIKDRLARARGQRPRQSVNTGERSIPVGAGSVFSRSFSPAARSSVSTDCLGGKAAKGAERPISNEQWGVLRPSIGLIDRSLVTSEWDLSADFIQKTFSRADGHSYGSLVTQDRVRGGKGAERPMSNGQLAISNGARKAEGATVHRTVGLAGSIYRRAGSIYRQAGSIYRQAGSIYSQVGSIYSQVGSKYSQAGGNFTRAIRAKGENSRNRRESAVTMDKSGLTVRFHHNYLITPKGKNPPRLLRAVPAVGGSSTSQFSRRKTDV
jgi:hypothetical protein